jgi:hypothetical protein
MHEIFEPEDFIPRLAALALWFGEHLSVLT